MGIEAGSGLGVCVQNSQGRASSSWGSQSESLRLVHSWGGVLLSNRKFPRGVVGSTKAGTEAPD